MDRESPELIEQEMEQTRQSLTEKVAALEHQVVGTIQTAATTVQDTVESVKSAVQDTVQAVKGTVSDVKETVEDSVSSVSEGVMHTFDFTHHVHRRPWLMVGGAAAAGFITGLLVSRRSGSTGLAGMFGPAMFGSPYHPPTGPAPRATTERDEPRRAEPKQPGWWDELMDRAGREASKLAEAALASVVAGVRRNIDEGLPRLIDNALHVQPRAESGPAGGRPNGASTPTQRTA